MNTLNQMNAMGQRNDTALMSLTIIFFDYHISWAMSHITHQCDILMTDIRTEKYLVDCKQSFNPFKIFATENKYISDDTQCELAFRNFKDLEQEVMFGLPLLHQ
ncbi:unnamed protein product [Wuchereria bancrofti]|uniref:Uncharacterized protein n=1 Tax=Wuchereria bancrofti TaxID=6293 RepID=A0A3P7EHB9_WUCBA|nr:unnamed protein product [Wuchereria bancrofti]